MDNKNEAVLRKMLQHTGAILECCGDCKTREAFEADSMRVEATVFNLMQLGELAKQSLDDEVKRTITTIPWQQIYGMRNRIVHGYSGVNMQIVWDTVSVDIPMLHEELKRVILDSLMEKMRDRPQKEEVDIMKCLMKYKWVKLHCSLLPQGKGAIGG